MVPPFADLRRLLLGRLGSAASSALPAARLAAAAALAPLHRTRPPQPPPAAAPRPRAPLVMLDPGHGGKDPGAIGISGTYEKHVVAGRGASS